MAMKEARLPSIGELAKAVQEGAAREKGAEGGVEASNEQRITQLRKELGSLEGEIKAAEKDVEVLQAEDGDESEVDPEVLKDDLAQLDAAIADLQAKEARREELMAEIATLETGLNEGIAEEASAETQKLHETALPAEDAVAFATKLAEVAPVNNVDIAGVKADLPLEAPAPVQAVEARPVEALETEEALDRKLDKLSRSINAGKSLLRDIEESLSKLDDKVRPTAADKTKMLELRGKIESLKIDIQAEEAQRAEVRRRLQQGLFQSEQAVAPKREAASVEVPVPREAASVASVDESASPMAEASVANDGRETGQGPVAEAVQAETVIEEPAIDPETQARIDENSKNQAEIQAKRDQAYEQHQSTEAARKRNLGPEKAEEYTLVEDSINKAGAQLEKLREEVEAGDEEVYKINQELYQSENGRRFLTRSYALDLIKGIREAKREGRSGLLPEQANNLEHLAKLYREYNSEAKMNLQEDMEGYMKRDEKSLADQENVLTSYASSMSEQRSELMKQRQEAEKTLHRNKNALRDLATQYNELIDRSNQLRSQSGITSTSPAEWRRFQADQFLENLKAYRGAIKLGE